MPCSSTSQRQCPALVPCRRWERCRRVNGSWRSVLLVVLLGLASLAVATPPKIYLVEVSENLINLHFDMDAFRSYTLQYRDSMTSGSWSNWQTIPTFPFDNHWVASDVHTNRARRFYRLSVTP